MPELSREQKIVIAIGASLIALGLIFLVLQLVGIEAAGTWVPIVAGVISLVLAVATRLPGFSILGCLLTFGGAGLLWWVYGGDKATDGIAEPVFLLFVSAGLCVVPILTRILDGKPMLWPLLPGGAGVAVGIILLSAG
jgi:hypothetical protein